MCLSAAFTAVCQGFPKGGVKVTLGVNEEGQLWEESRTHSGRTCSLPFHPETTGGFNQNEE